MGHSSRRNANHLSEKLSTKPNIYIIRQKFNHFYRGHWQYICCHHSKAHWWNSMARQMAQKYFWESSRYLFEVWATCLEFGILVWSSIYLFGAWYTFFEFEIIPTEFVILFLRLSYSWGIRDTSFRECMFVVRKWTIVRLIRLVMGYFLDTSLMSRDTYCMSRDTSWRRDSRCRT